MFLKKRLNHVAVQSVAMLGLTCAAASAGSHLWRINEIFSNADGSVQFIELKECCGSTIETALAGKPLISTAFNPDHVFTFPVNLSGSTANRYLLIATPAFAALPGAPTPDFFFSQVPFFVINGDLIEWAPQLNYDEFAFGAGALPTDGIGSIHITNYTTDTFVTGVNSPTNYAGGTGSVNAGCIDNDGDGYGTPGAVACAGGDESDCNDANSAINPGEVEVCGDIVDNNCDHQSDCADSDCTAFCASAPGCGPCRIYGSVASFPCLCDLDDILYVLASFEEPETFPDGDIEPCGGDGDVDVDDLLAEIDAFSGSFACPHPCPPGACFGEFEDTPPNPNECRDQFSNGGGMSESDCYLRSGGLATWCGAGVFCGDADCPP